MKKMFLITIPLLSGERLCQREIVQIVKEENYLVEEAVDILLGDCSSFDIVGQKIFEHVATVLADNEDEAYNVYLEKHLEKKNNIPYFFKEQLNFIELA